MAFIYKITNDVNGKVYIGKTLQDVEKRWKEQIRDSKKERYMNRPLYRAMNKYGVKHFTVEIIEECSTENSDEREVFWIKEYGSFGDGYNATIGGDGKSYTNRALILWLWLGNMSSKQITEFTGYDYGNVKSVLKSFGITTEELIMRGKPNLKPVAMYSLKGDYIKSFRSITDACKYLNTDPRNSHIRSVCKGERQSAHGYKWKYL